MFRAVAARRQFLLCARSLNLPRDVKYDQGPSYYVIPEVPNESISKTKFFDVANLSQINNITPEVAFNEFSRLLITYHLSLSKISEEIRQKGISDLDARALKVSLEKVFYPLEHAFQILRSITSFEDDPMWNIFISRLAQKLKSSRSEYFCLDPDIHSALLRVNEANANVSPSDKEVLSALLDECWKHGANLITTRKVGSQLLRFSSKVEDSGAERDISCLRDLQGQLEKEEEQFQAMVLASSSVSEAELARSRYTGRLPDRSNLILFSAGSQVPIAESDLAPSAPYWLPNVLGGSQLGGHLADMKVDLNSDVLVKSVLKHCSTRQVRKSLWLSWVQRASVKSFGGSSGHHASNDSRIQTIRRLRRSLANMLGCEDWLQVMWHSRHWRSPQSPDSLIDDLLEPLRIHLKPEGKNELQLLSEWASSNLDLHGTKLETWDIDYAIEQYNFAATFAQLQTQFSPPSGSLTTYLLQALNELASFFQLNLIQQPLSKENQFFESEDVSVLRVEDAASGEPFGEIIVDLFEKPYRPAFLGEAVPIPLILRKPYLPWSSETDYASPGHHSVVTLVSSLPKSAETEGVKVQDLMSIASGFGSCLQYILPRAYHHHRSGLTPCLAPDMKYLVGDVCSALMFRSILPVNHPTDSHKPMGSFYSNPECGRPPPPGRILVLPLLRQLYEARFDLAMWSAKDRSRHWISLNDQLWSQHLPYARYSEDSWPCSSSELFGPNSECGLQYQHVWRQVVFHDILAALRETGWPTNKSASVLNVFKQFRDIFMGVKDQLPAAELFRLFRGRDPKPEHLLQALKLRPRLVESAVLPNQLHDSLVRQ